MFPLPNDTDSPPVRVMVLHALVYGHRLFYQEPIPITDAVVPGRSSRLFLFLLQFGRQPRHNAEPVADPRQPLGQRLQRQILTPRQHMTEHVLRNAGRLTEGPPRRKLFPNQIFQIPLVIVRADLAGGQAQAVAQILGDPPGNRSGYDLPGQATAFVEGGYGDGPPIVERIPIRVRAIPPLDAGQQFAPSASRWTR